MIEMCAAKKLMVRTVYQRKGRMRMETKEGLEEEKVGEKGEEGQRSEWKESEIDGQEFAKVGLLRVI